MSSLQDDHEGQRPDMKTPSIWDLFPRASAYVNERLGFSEAEVTAIMDGIRTRGDRLMTIFLSCHAVVAMLLAAFYDTWLLAVSIATFAVTMFFVSARLLPGQFITR